MCVYSYFYWQKSLLDKKGVLLAEGSLCTLIIHSLLSDVEKIQFYKTKLIRITLIKRFLKRGQGNQI